MHERILENIQKKSIQQSIEEKKVKEDNALRNVSVDVVTNSSNMKQKVLLMMMMMNKIGLFDSDKIFPWCEYKIGKEILKFGSSNRKQEFHVQKGQSLLTIYILIR